MISCKCNCHHTTDADWTDVCPNCADGCKEDKK